MSLPVKRGCTHPPSSWARFCKYAKELLRSVEVRSFLACAVLVLLTGLFSPVAVFVMVISNLVSFLIGAAYGPTIVAHLAGDNVNTSVTETASPLRSAHSKDCVERRSAEGERHDSDGGSDS